MEAEWQFDFGLKEENLQNIYGKGNVFWLVGMSGSGKSTLCDKISHKLIDKNLRFIILDGDKFRSTISKDLGFTEVDRSENLRRAAYVAQLFCQQGFIVLCSFITPLEENRILIKNILQEFYTEVFIDTPLEVCVKRDPKGLYKKAMNGEIQNFTGVSSTFEPPQKSDIVLNGTEDSDFNANLLMAKILEKKV